MENDYKNSVIYRIYCKIPIFQNVILVQQNVLKIDFL